MLAPLVVDLLISCTVLMLAGWTYDVLGEVGPHKPPGRSLHGIVIDRRSEAD